MGEILTSSGTMASINPLRYRGYYYDTETGFYYLQSRYYDPVLHRFINADSAEYSAMSALAINGTNLFAYCQNNPVNGIDPTGEWNWYGAVVGAVVGAIVNVVTTVIDAVDEGGLDALTEKETWCDIGEAVIEGAVTGGMIGFCPTPSTVALVATFNAANTYIDCREEGASVDTSLNCAAVSFTFSFVSSDCDLIQEEIAFDLVVSISELIINNVYSTKW